MTLLVHFAMLKYMVNHDTSANQMIPMTKIYIWNLHLCGNKNVFTKISKQYLILQGDII